MRWQPYVVVGKGWSISMKIHYFGILVIFWNCYAVSGQLCWHSTDPFFDDNVVFAEFPMQNLVESPQILKYMECKESHLMSWLLTMERKVRILQKKWKNMLLSCYFLHFCIIIIVIGKPILSPIFSSYVVPSTLKLGT